MTHILTKRRGLLGRLSAIVLGLAVMTTWAQPAEAQLWRRNWGARGYVARPRVWGGYYGGGYGYPNYYSRGYYGVPYGGYGGYGVYPAPLAPNYYYRGYGGYGGYSNFIPPML